MQGDRGGALTPLVKTCARSALGGGLASDPSLMLLFQGSPSRVPATLEVFIHLVLLLLRLGVGDPISHVFAHMNDYTSVLTF